MKKAELLAPAGDFECLKAAILGGADAVYIGGSAFGARSFAKNFNNEEIVEAIKYAHLYGVKVYVTLNTLIYDDEVDEFLNYAKFLHKNNVDAVIMQDLGMVDLIHQVLPNLEIHASTQMHIHNKEGVMFAKSLGVKRIVLARETPIEKIKKIKEETNMPLEVFIHGALCVSYSGQCLMSSLIGGRSGNRGSCVQCCRMPYKLFTDKKIDEGYLLSMKDLNTSSYLKQILDSNVDSLKIEGRMKNPGYVLKTVQLYRRLIDNYYANKDMTVTDKEIKDLKKTFNRNFTKGFIFNEENNNVISKFRPNHQGIKIGEVISCNDKFVTIKLSDDVSQNDGIRIIGKKDVGFNLNYIYKNKKLVSTAYKGDIISLPINDKVEKNSLVVKTSDYLLNEEIKKELEMVKKIPIIGTVEIKKDGFVYFEVSDGENTVYLKENIVFRALTFPITKESVIKQLSKLGNTIFEFKKINVIIDSDLFVNIKDLNELRRNAILELEKKRLYEIPYAEKKYEIKPLNIDITNEFSVLIHNKDTLNEIKDKHFDKVIVDDIKLLNDFNNAIYRLPRVVDNYDLLNNDLLITEVGGLYKYKGQMTDYSLNVTNSYTVYLLHKLGVKKITLSYELDMKRINNLVASFKKRYNMLPNLELIIYGYEEVMISKYNLLKTYNLQYGYLENNKKDRFLVKEKDDKMIIYNYKLRDIKDYKGVVTNFRMNLDYK